MVKYHIYLSKEGGTFKASITYSFKSSTVSSESTNSIMLRTSFSDRIPHLVWYTKVHYYIHYSPSLAPIPILMNSVHSIIYYFCMTHINISLQSVHKCNRFLSSLQVIQLHFYINSSPLSNKLHASLISFWSSFHHLNNKGSSAIRRYLVYVPIVGRYRTYYWKIHNCSKDLDDYNTSYM